MNEATGGRGVDVAFDTIGGEVTTQTFRCMAFNGRHVIAGFPAGIEAEDQGIVPRPLLFGNFSLLGVCHAYVEDPLVFRAGIGFNSRRTPMAWCCTRSCSRWWSRGA